MSQNIRRLRALRACFASPAAEIVLREGSSLRAIKESLLPVAREFPDQSVVAEIGAALDEARQMAPQARRQDVERISNGMEREIATLSALDRAAMDSKRIECFADNMASSFAHIETSILKIKGEDRPIAWLVKALRKG